MLKELDTTSPCTLLANIKDCFVGKVLIDNSSTFNKLPKHMLNEMPVNPSHIQPSAMIARAYDGSLRQVIRIMGIELAIGLFLSNIASNGYSPLL
jgi:hypothetical protein